jgi:hypothetical protein
MKNVNTELLLARFNSNPPTSWEVIEQVQQNVGFSFPRGYIEFFLARDGGEGFIGRSYLMLWRVEELIKMNAAYHIAEFAPNLLLFGSDGGGNAFGFDNRSNTVEIISVPFMDLQLVAPLAKDFEEFLSVLFTS